MTPKLTSGNPILALSLAILKWQAIANSKPPPSANPLTAAITGVLKFSIKSNNISCPFFANFVPSFTLKSANSEISAPATKAFSPLPVKIITRISSSSSALSNASCNSLIVARFNAFNFDGLLIVIKEMFSSFFTDMLSIFHGIYFLGKVTVKTVPLLDSDANEILPLYASTIFFTIGKPRPIPLDLVVNFGSNILFLSLSVMPLPLSATVIIISLPCLTP